MLVLIPSNKIENTLCWIIFNPYIIAKQTNKQKKNNKNVDIIKLIWIVNEHSCKSMYRYLSKVEALVKVDGSAAWSKSLLFPHFIKYFSLWLNCFHENCNFVTLLCYRCCDNQYEVSRADHLHVCQHVHTFAA